jgi:archaellum biogenesis ATPase FlaH
MSEVTTLHGSAQAVPEPVSLPVLVETQDEPVVHILPDDVLLRAWLSGQPAQGEPNPDSPFIEELIALNQIVSDGGGTTSVRKAFEALCKSSANFAREFEGMGRRGRISVGELLAQEIEPTAWLVGGLLKSGLFLLAGRPKTGKSWMALQFAHAVSTGGDVLGLQAVQGRTLYLALEDSAERMHRRAQAQGIGADSPLDFEFEVEPFDEPSGLENIIRLIGSGEYGLIIVDTFSRVLSRSDQNDLKSINPILSKLQHCALASDVCLLLIDHHRKQGSQHHADAISDVMGSTGKSAVADGVLALYRTTGEMNAELVAVGRDLETVTLNLQWNRARSKWDVVETVAETQPECLEGMIAREVEKLSAEGEVPTTKKIAQALERRTSNISRSMNEMVTSGVLRKGEKQGRIQAYHLVGDDSSQSITADDGSSLKAGQGETGSDLSSIVDDDNNSQSSTSGNGSSLKAGQGETDSLLVVKEHEVSI